MEVLFPLYMDSLRYMKRSIGMLFFVLSVFLVLSQPFIGYWIQRVNPSVPIISGFVLIAGALSLMVVGTSFACWIPVFIVFGVAMGMLVSVSMLLIALHSRPSEQGAAYGIWNFSFSVGYLVGPALGGTLSDFFKAKVPSLGLQSPFFIFSFLMLLGLFFLLMLRKNPLVS